MSDPIVTIHYNGQNPFIGLPTPFVSRGQTVLFDSRRQGLLSSVSLKGQITGNFNQLLNSGNSIVESFNKDFQLLEIKETGEVIFQQDFCKIISVSFESSPFNSLVDYTIEIEGYDPSLFLNTYGVLDPQNSVDFSEDEEGNVSISHSISAKGFNTSRTTNNALSNAKNFVLSLTGWNNQILPKFINLQGESSIDPILLDYSEEVNRIDGTYSVSEKYIFNPNFASSGIFRKFNASLNSGIDSDFVTLSLNGELRGGKNQTLPSIRTFLNDLDIYSIAQSFAPDIPLNPIPVSFSVSENAQSKTVSFDASFDNNLLFSQDGNGNSYYDYTVDFSTDEITSVTSIDIDGKILSRGGNLAQKNFNSLTFFSGISPKISEFLYNKITGVYDDLGFAYSVNPKAISLNVNSNTFAAEIGIKASFSDADFIDHTGIKNTTYSVGINASNDVYAPRPSFNDNGYYIIYDINAKTRERVSIETNFQIDRKASVVGADIQAKVAEINSGIRSVFVANPLIQQEEDTYSPRLDSESIENNRFSNSVRVSREYSQSQKNPIISPTKISTS